MGGCLRRCARVPEHGVRNAGGPPEGHAHSLLSVLPPLSFLAKSGNIWQTVPMALTITDARVFAATAGVWMTAPQIARLADLPERTTRYSLTKLTKLGLLRRQSASPAPYYSRNPESPKGPTHEIQELALIAGVVL